MAAPRRGRFLSLYWRLHKFWYELTGGRLGSRLMGWDVLRLTTRGRKSGERRSVLLNYFKDGDAFVVVGSNVGDDRHPAWWMNLKAHPEAVVRVGTTDVRCRAREAQHTERQILWQQVTARDPSYAAYARRTSRQIPVVLLEPVRAPLPVERRA